MLMNHTNFHFTQIQDKTNDLNLNVFGPFLTIFGHFCPIGTFSKRNLALSHTTIYGHLTLCQVSEGPTERQTLFYRTLLAEAGGSKICKWKTSFKIKYVNKNFVNFIQISTASCIYFEAMKWCWTNFQMQVA